MKSPFFSQKHARTGAFTLIEALVASCAFCVLGLIIYGVASESLFAFSRNVSINHSYADARRALDRIENAVATSGYTPLLVDATGAATNTSPAPGIRFWRYSSTPCYNITSPTMSATSVVISLLQPGSTTIRQTPPVVGDLINVPSLGFQAKAVTVTTSGTSATVTFSGSFSSNTNPVITSIPTTQQTTTSSGTTTTNIQYFCLDWHPVAVIAVGTDLRYYPTFIYGTTSVSTAANYKVITNLVATVAGSAAPLPFSLGPSPTVNVDLYAQATDYSNRTANINSPNNYTYFQTAVSSRNPTLLTNPYN